MEPIVPKPLAPVSTVPQDYTLQCLTRPEFNNVQCDKGESARVLGDVMARAG